MSGGHRPRGVPALWAGLCINTRAGGTRVTRKRVFLVSSYANAVLNNTNIRPQAFSACSWL
jgi:hypothetical protein